MSNDVQRIFATAGDESPQVEDDFGNVRNIEMAGTPGFYAAVETGDEIIVLTPYNSKLDRVAVGVVPPVKFGLQPGDRLIITNNCQIKLQSNGQIDIQSTTGNVNVKTGGIVTIDATRVNLP